jgi:hypothetical protein
MATSLFIWSPAECAKRLMLQDWRHEPVIGPRHFFDDKSLLAVGELTKVHGGLR